MVIARRFPTRKDAARRARTVPTTVRIGLLLIALQLAFRAWALWGSWFYFDDLAFMSRAMNQPFDTAYLTESYGGHLMPAAFALVRLLTEIAVYDWWVWAVVLLVLQAVAGVGMLRLLVAMFGHRRFVLVLLAGYLFWVLTLSAGIWFAAGVNQLPMQIALVFGLHAHLSYLRERRTRSLVAATAWVVAGLLFYEKTLLVLLVYGLVALCWFGTGNTPDRLRQLWATYRPAIVTYTVLGVGYAALYAAYGLNFSPGTANSQPLTPVAWNLLFVALFPALIGGPVTWQPLDVGSFADPSQFVQAVSWVAVGAVAYWAWHTRTLSKRAWALVLLPALANTVLLASARANIVGPDIAREYRYQTESAALVVLAIGLAFLPLKGAPVVNDTRPDVPLTYETPRLVRWATVAVCLLAAVSTVRYVDLWQSRNPTEAWYSQVRSSLAAAPRKPVPLVDATVPQTMLWGYRYPENTYSHVLRNLSSQTAYPKAAVDRLYVLDFRGRVQPVLIPPTRTLLPSVGCGYSMKGQRRMVLPLNGPVVGGGWWVRMGYQSDEAVVLTVTGGEAEHVLRLPAGLHSAFFTVAGDNFERIKLAGNARGADLCVNDLTLGLPQAVER